MSFHSIKGYHRVWPSILIALTILLIAGCTVNEKTWIDKMLSEMESAWIEADKAGGGQEGRDAAVTVVAEKYFRPGTSKKEAFQLLRELKDYGFKINESRHEGTRGWPDEEFRSPWSRSTNPYADKETTRNVQLYHSKLKDLSHFSVVKMYGRERVIIEKNASISFNIADKLNVIDDVQAFIWTNSL